MKVYKTWDSFLWADVSHIAEILWQSQDFELYAICDDQSEYLINTQNELEEAKNNNCIIAIELCFLGDIINLNN